MSINRVHSQSTNKQHFAISEAGCPMCQVTKGQFCIDKSVQIDKSVRTHTLLPSHTVHVARVQATGHNVR